MGFLPQGWDFSPKDGIFSPKNGFSPQRWGFAPKGPPRRGCQEGGEAAGCGMSRHRALEQQQQEQQEEEQELLCPAKLSVALSILSIPSSKQHKKQNPSIPFFYPRGFQGRTLCEPPPGPPGDLRATPGPLLRAGSVPSQPRRILSPLPAAKFLEGFQSAWLQEQPVHSFIPGWAGRAGIVPLQPHLATGMGLCPALGAAEGDVPSRW